MPSLVPITFHENLFLFVFGMKTLAQKTLFARAAERAQECLAAPSCPCSFLPRSANPVSGS
jgi:hypothetical protein